MAHTRTAVSQLNPTMQEKQKKPTMQEKQKTPDKFKDDSQDLPGVHASMLSPTTLSGVA